MAATHTNERLVFEERPDGIFFVNDKTEFFRARSRTMRVAVSDLVVTQHVRAKDASVTNTIDGLAGLEGDRVSVIGDDGNSTGQLRLRIFSGDLALRTEESAPGMAKSFGALFQVFGAAELGFSSADYEIGNRDEWWLQITIPQPAMDALVSAIRADENPKILAHLSFAGADFYLKHKYLPPSADVTWFLQPSRTDNDPANPEIAVGGLTAFGWKIGGSKPESDLPLEHNVGALERPREDQNAVIQAEQLKIARAQLHAIWFAIALAFLMFLMR